MQLDFPQIIVNFLVDAAPQTIDETIFKTAVIRLICFYGRDASGERYLNRYQECKSFLKVVVLEIRAPRDGQRRRALQAVVRFYAFVTSMEAPVNGTVATNALAAASEQYVITEFGTTISDAWTLLLEVASSTTIAPQTPASSGANDEDSSLTIIVAAVGVVLVFLIVAVILYQRRALRAQLQLTKRRMVSPLAQSLATMPNNRSQVNDWDAVEGALMGHVTVPKAPATGRARDNHWDDSATMLADHDAHTAHGVSAWSTRADPGTEVRSTSESDDGAYVDYTRANLRHGAPPTPALGAESSIEYQKPTARPPVAMYAVPSDVDTYKQNPSYMQAISDYDEGYVQVSVNDNVITSSSDVLDTMPTSIRRLSAGKGASPLTKQKQSLQRMLELCERQISATPVGAPAATVLNMTKESILQQMSWIDDGTDKTLGRAGKLVQNQNRDVAGEQTVSTSTFVLITIHRVSQCHQVLSNLPPAGNCIALN